MKIWVYMSVMLNIGIIKNNELWYVFESIVCSVCCKVYINVW